MSKLKYYPSNLQFLPATVAVILLAAAGENLKGADLVRVAGNSIWDLSSTTWNGGTTAWSNASDTAIFSAAGGGNMRVEDVTALDARGIFGSLISFRANGYELYSNVAGGAKMQLSGGTAVEVRPGITATFGGVALTASGDATTISGGGTLHMSNAGSIWRSSSGQLRIGGNSTVRLAAGANLGGAFLGNTIVVGHNGNGTLHIDGGDVNVGNGSQNRSLIVGGASSATNAQVNLNEGTVWIKTNSSSGLILGTSAMGTNQSTFRLNGGFLRTPDVRSEGGNASFIFNGGTLQTTAASPSLFAGVYKVLVGAEPARLSSGDGYGGYSSTMSAPLTRDPSLGNARDGGVVKLDFGEIRLAPGSNYQGDTVVERGVLTLPDPALSMESSVRLGTNGKLNLDFDGVITVKNLHINGQPQTPGTWGGEGSGANHISSNFLGSGVLKVLSKGAVPTTMVPTKGQWLGRDWDPALLATIPDPLVMEDGSPVTTPSKWIEERRSEVLELFKEHVYGHNAVESPQQLRFSAGTKTSVFSGKATRQRVDISYTGPGGSGGFPVHIHVPVSGKVKGIFLYIGPSSGDSTNTSSYPAEAAINRGYAVAGFRFSDLADDSESTALKSGVFSVFGPTGTWQNNLYPDRPSNAWSAVGAWAWGASRCIDYFKSVPSLEPLPIAVLGHSRRGKAALWCGAQDSRVDLTIPNSSGSTGAAMARLKGGERVAKINGDFAHWFCDNYKKFNDNEEAMPVDQHMLVALCAPRLVYVQSSYVDYWADPNAEFESCLQAGPIYDLFDLGIVGSRARPGANIPLHTGAIAYHARGDEFDGGHRLTAYDWQRFMDYADLRFPAISSSLKSWRKSNGLNELGEDDFRTRSADGVSNIMKYALNLPDVEDPAFQMTMGGNSGLPAFAPNGEAGVDFQFVRRKAATVPGIRYIPEQTEDFEFWDPLASPAGVASIDGTWERVTFRNDFDESSSGRKFFRLRVGK